MPRVLPPAGTSIFFSDILATLASIFGKKRYLERFKEDIRRYFNVKHCFLVSSGRAALTMLFMAMRNLQGDKNEVVLPAYTSFSVPSAVVKTGLRISLYDVDPETLSPNIESLKEAITEATLCVVVCHLYGYPCDMDAILKVAKERGVYVIDDSGQAMGAKYKGKYIGTFGEAGIFSLNRGKNITTVEGGIIVTDSDVIAQELDNIDLGKRKYLDTFTILLEALVMAMFIRSNLYWMLRKLPFLHLGKSMFSTDFHLKEYMAVQASLGIRMLERLESINKSRVVKANRLVEKFGTCKGIKFPRIVEGAEPVFLRLPLIYDGLSQIDNIDLGVVRSYPYPINEIEVLKPHINVGKNKFPGAKFLTKKTWTLPTHACVNGADMNLIVKNILYQII